MNLAHKALLTAILCFMFGVVRGSAQHEEHADVPVALHASLTIEADVAGARVFLNGEERGHTPLTLDSVPPGSYQLSIVHPRSESWFVDTITDSLEVHEGEHRTLRYSLGARIFITSDPFGAVVYAGDSAVGTTPVVLQPGFAAIHSRLFLEKAGYERTQVDLLNKSAGTYAIPLKRSSLLEGNADVLPGELHPGGETPVRLYLSGAAAILAGGAAAYFKVRADNAYADYRITRNPAHLSKTKRLDTAAGIALAATQLSLGLFTYFLLAE